MHGSSGSLLAANCPIVRGPSVPNPKSTIGPACLFVESSLLPQSLGHDQYLYPRAGSSRRYLDLAGGPALSRDRSGHARLLLADDHDLLLEAFRRLLEPEFTVLRGVTDGEALVAAALELRPDAILCDIAMPRLSGLEAARRIRERLPGIRFIFLTMHNDPELAAEAFRAGASAYVLKSSPAKELLLAIRTVVSGEQYVACNVGKRTHRPAKPPSG